MHDIDWWISKLERVSPSGKGYVALCPAHDDHEVSLSVREASGGGVLVNCFKGCLYHDIEEALETDEDKAIIKLTPISQIRIPSSMQEQFDPGEVWESYTQVPRDFWEGLGCRFENNQIVFTWEEVITEKSRTLKGAKKFSWQPFGSPRPFLWPSVPFQLGETIWIAEGESDTGVLRYLGLEAFGITKGVESAGLMEPIWKELQSRGCKRLIFTSDLDVGGTKFLTRVASQLQLLGIAGFSVQLESLVNPFLGEKDVRDLWLRYMDEKALRLDLEGNLKLISERVTVERIFLQDFLTLHVPDQHWIVEKTLMAQTVGLLVGSPKIGKSWLALDMAVSIAAGRSFLDEFKVSSPGPVLYISKEDPAYSLQSRLAGILTSKGLGGTVTKDGNIYRVKFPSMEPIPLVIDLSRGFQFSPEHIDELVIYLRALKESFGAISAVVFDPILRMIGLGIDEFKVTEVNQAVFEPAARIVAEVGTSVLLVHHRSKGGIEGKSSYGSIAFHAFADSTLFIQGTTPDANGWVPVHSEFKSAPEHDWSYKLELDDSYRVLVDCRAKSFTLQDDLLAALKESSDGTYVSDLQMRFQNVELITLRWALKQLEGAGLSRREKEKEKAAGAKGGPKRDLWFATEED